MFNKFKLLYQSIKNTGENVDTCIPDVKENDPIIFNEAQLVLAEKRTHLAMLRTGIAIVALPMSVISFLVATSRFYEIGDNLHYLIPLFVLNILLSCLGIYMAVRSLIKLRQDGRLMENLKLKNHLLSSLMDD
ncbi:MAG: hypothetical protein WA151_10755 [Desulfatirhabdiaceae bacterium]